MIPCSSPSCQHVDKNCQDIGHETLLRINVSGRHGDLEQINFLSHVGKPGEWLKVDSGALLTWQQTNPHQVIEVLQRDRQRRFVNCRFLLPNVALARGRLVVDANGETWLIFPASFLIGWRRWQREVKREASRRQRAAKSTRKAASRG